MVGSSVEPTRPVHARLRCVTPKMSASKTVPAAVSPGSYGSARSSISWHAPLGGQARRPSTLAGRLFPTRGCPSGARLQSPTGACASAVAGTTNAAATAAMTKRIACQRSARESDA